MLAVCCGYGGLQAGFDVRVKITVEDEGLELLGCHIPRLGPTDGFKFREVSEVRKAAALEWLYRLDEPSALCSELIGFDPNSKITLTICGKGDHGLKICRRSANRLKVWIVERKRSFQDETLNLS